MTIGDDELNRLIDNKITSYSFDMLKNIISLTVEENLKDGSVKEHTIEFLKVATAYYVNSSSRKHFTAWEEDDWLELSGVGVLQEPIDFEVNSPIGASWVENCKGGANIILEIWDETVLIEAAEVRVDGESFVIGDW